MSKSNQVYLGLFLLLLISGVSRIFCQSISNLENNVLWEWNFEPEYSVQGENLKQSPKSVLSETLQKTRSKMNFAGLQETESLPFMYRADDLLKGDFSIELWFSYHVTNPVGVLLYFTDREFTDDPNFYLGISEGNLFIKSSDLETNFPMFAYGNNVWKATEETKYRIGAQEYWHHIIVSRNENTLLIFHNGKLSKNIELKVDDGKDLSNQYLSASSFLEKEPFMETGNILKHVTIFEKVFTQEEAGVRFQNFLERLNQGLFMEDQLRFTSSAPLITWKDDNSIHLLWETNLPVKTIIKWGLEKDKLENILEIPNNGNRINRGILNRLRKNTNYFYQLELDSEDGQKLISPIYSFFSKKNDNGPITIAAFSDSEARPHVNAQVSRLVWNEEPDLVINAGDLTDGGFENNKGQWTFEYLQALGPLMSRVFFLQVMGNGEDDFKWYNYFFNRSGSGASYFSYQIGNVEVFVLDSNFKKRSPKFRENQRIWLEESLKKSKADWKIATHHHPNLEWYPGVKEDFVPLYEKYGVDFVLVGHHHNYKRTWPLTDDKVDLNNGVTYIQLGSSGGSLSTGPSDSIILKNKKYWAKNYFGYSYSTFRIYEGHLEYSMYGVDGMLWDSFVIDK